MTKISVQSLLHIQFKVEGGEEAGAILLVSGIIEERSNDGENLEILMNENKKCKQELIEMGHASRKCNVYSIQPTRYRIYTLLTGSASGLDLSLVPVPLINVSVILDTRADLPRRNSG